ncbi:hypothetical protein F8M41_025556 [Gigaspora margarita]|uniref:Uncharacterized protein n=1 Tax=Gigaspora margarita TaxID=4874 RepID=A0A8H4B002_GIGMA|nr:hypothetical protein F8M41_025556 [Gigaspora margarita]
MKFKIKYWLDEIIISDEVNEIITQEIEGSYDVDEIIEQLEDKINNSKGLTDLDEIKKQINRIKDSNHENEIIKNKIKYWLDEIKVTDQVNEIINQFKECLNKLNDSEGASKIKKKQIKSQLVK